LQKSVFRLMQESVEKIDITRHKGKHPRVGVVDVIPFVPVGGSTMEQCVRLARRVGKEIAESFGVPVYLYEKAAKDPERASIERIREGEFEGFQEKIKLPEWKPDFGPDRVHPTAGVTTVGARPPLHALNIELNTDDRELAGRVSEAISLVGGETKRIATHVVNQRPEPRIRIAVSVMNHEKVPLFRVVEAARTEAARLGVDVVKVEMVGLVIAQALFDCLEHYMQLSDFDLMQLLEMHLSTRQRKGF